MKWSEVWRTGLLPGALAGLVGGLVFGVTMSEMGLLPNIAQIARVGLLAARLLGAALRAQDQILASTAMLPGGSHLASWRLPWSSACWLVGASPCFIRVRLTAPEPASFAVRFTVFSGGWPVR